MTLDYEKTMGIALSIKGKVVAFLADEVIIRNILVYKGDQPSKQRAHHYIGRYKSKDKGGAHWDMIQLKVKHNGKWEDIDLGSNTLFSGEEILRKVNESCAVTGMIDGFCVLKVGELESEESEPS